MYMKRDLYMKETYVHQKRLVICHMINDLYM